MDYNSKDICSALKKANIKKVTQYFATLISGFLVNLME